MLQIVCFMKAFLDQISILEGPYLTSFLALRVGVIGRLDNIHMLELSGTGHLPHADDTDRQALLIITKTIKTNFVQCRNILIQ